MPIVRNVVLAAFGRDHGVEAADLVLVLAEHQLVIVKVAGHEMVGKLHAVKAAMGTGLALFGHVIFIKPRR